MFSPGITELNLKIDGFVYIVSRKKKHNHKNEYCYRKGKCLLINRQQFHLRGCKSTHMVGD